ncbi:SDR family NAD(P)-dependent oxidoreductase [Anaerotignum sp. MB30-C6]|uniref:SDR family NAD(P)-dependent oxidoreductase n=1 Tax=Anaerotignum sp. MB30-C6 TaxID=3070814 RepID=UPI0027DD253C|nr:SDR family NAD(P)-dependent oxidoreductase [Anaerotignum sp. MB30-C6]WMI80267.1 SDR family NAD(P)-dependent oxidoreductase [Anaerotignum sp. MB30-C6]
MVSFDLTGKKAIVTGSTRGLGRGMAEGLMEAGAEVVIMGTSTKALEVATEYTEKGFLCHGVAADLGNRESLIGGFNEAMEKLGGTLDVFVNAAGIQRRHFSEEFPMEDWDAVIDVNLNAVFMLCQLAGKEMIKNGYGKIINVASMLSFFGGFTVPAYAASKGAVAQLTKALSNEWTSKGINVNAIAPGYMATEMNTALINDEGRSKEILGRIPAKRWGNREDMKGITIFLASQASDYLSGAVIPVDGGYLGK